MDIRVKRSSPHGSSSIEGNEYISRWQFAKHLAFAGLGTCRGGFVPFRLVAQFIDFFQYWDDRQNCFCLPPVVENDPTERNFVSNRIGKALADFCAKKYSGAIYTHCYEDVMAICGLKITGERPDFYCVTPSKQFAIEAKGFSRKSISENEMLKHKTQSTTGPISVHFSMASVAHDLYASPKVKYYDPPNEGVVYDSETNFKLRIDYYTSILNGIDYYRINQLERRIQENYFEYPLSFEGSDYSVIIHEDVINKKWLKEDWIRGLNIQASHLDFGFIDVDGIGLCATSKGSNQ